tara:strand:+ start:620 stop:1084 length:465 start_codon:yes stop_codon:yes gene_type:complete
MTKPIQQRDPIRDGHNVTLHYRGTLDDGTEFDSSRSRIDPVTVEVGTGQLIPAFEKALHGLTRGDIKTFTLLSEDAYGPRDPNAIVTLQKDVFPPEFAFQAGGVVPLTNQEGQTFMGSITEVADTTVKADLNHPMAGKNLTFAVEIIGVTNPPA